MLVAEIHRQLVHRFEPSTWQLAGEAVIPEQHVGDAVALRAGEPGGDERVHGADVRLHHERTPGDEHHHALDEPAHVLDHLRPRRRDGQVQVVPLRLRVRLLPHHHHRVVVLLGALGDRALVRVLRVVDHRALVHRRLDRLQDRRPCITIHISGKRDGESAALEAEVVGVAAGDEDLVGLLGQRQHGLLPVLAVLEQDERPAHGLARDLPVLLVAELAGEARVRERVLEEAHGELDAEDAAHGVVDPVQLDRPVRHLRRQVGDELRVVVRDHHHVNARVDRLLDRVVVVLVRRRRDPVHRLPVLALVTLNFNLFLRMSVMRKRFSCILTPFQLE
ncbi:Os03g0749200 [Oryza sativa Japonica Group]|uniref:Os03g0749200 protein n=1 Tax=Oryza sativa subsp. japonica TaxID=39947 RepID=A0A0P0W314_ORYSJ|nr:hypothetical protein EE612_020441 [Oryza sativa]BAS86391.1 Os03g0749200 [Oryza sativa Japonica Group]